MATLNLSSLYVSKDLSDHWNKKVLENKVSIIHKLCHEKQWAKAEIEFFKYQQACRDLWIEYDTHLNYKKNCCGMCRQMKKALVKRTWADKEYYPTARHLVCKNFDCKFYFIINTDKHD